MNIKRINLSFVLDRKDDLAVYNILASQKYKTDFVIKAVLDYIEKDKENRVDKEIIKQAVKEAIDECKIQTFYSHETETKDSKESVQEELPKEIFDMLSSL